MRSAATDMFLRVVTRVMRAEEEEWRSTPERCSSRAGRVSSKKGVAKLIFPVKQARWPANANCPSDAASRDLADLTLSCPTHFPRLSGSGLILKLPVMSRGTS